MKKLKVAVIGGGLSGLTVAWELVKNGHRAVVFEKEKNPGGLARSFKKKGWSWSLDQFYRHVFSSDSDFKNLVKELGLEDKLFFKRPKTSVYLKGNTIAFDSPIDVLRFPYLKLNSRIHLGLGTVIMKFLPYSKLYEKLTIEKLPILVGTEAYSKIWQPLIKQKFGKFWKQIPLSWFWARIRSRTANLGYFEKGFSEFVKTLCQKIVLKRGEIKTGQKSMKIEKSNEKFFVYSSGKKYLFDKVILATPLPVSLDKFANLLPEEKRKYSAVKTVGAAVLVLELKEKLLAKNTYWLNILEKNWPFIAVVEQTNFINKKNYNRNPVVYLGGYYSWDDPIFKMSKSEVEKMFLPFAKKINPNVKNLISGSWFFTNLYSQPVPEQEQSIKVPKFKTSTPGVYWINMNHIFPWDRGMNYSVKYGKLLARQLIKEEKND